MLARGMEQEEYFSIAGVIANWYTTLEINLVVSQKTWNCSTARHSYTIPGHIHKIFPTILQGTLAPLCS